MKFFVNSDCIGCGLCPSVCPEVFSMTDEGVAKACDCDVSGSTAACAEEAQQQCPVSAIEHD
ncbi:MAG: ferredoxin [Oscillospiraceae bacterium]|nr:ferredoxin [Oscillospiraceae bacterium]